MGATLLGGGMFVGFVSALVGRRQQALLPDGSATPDPLLPQRVEELARAVAALQSHLEKPAGEVPVPPPVIEQLSAVSLRVAGLEQRIEEMAANPGALPPVDHVLAAVEQMVADKIEGIDERLSDQVRAIEELRKASTQTDSLLEKLLSAVETLTAQLPEREPGEAATDGQTAAAGRDYPIA